jgi:hypothetical protein
MTSVHRGPHAGHDLQDWEDVMNETKKKIKMEGKKMEEIEMKSRQLFDTIQNSLVAWKRSLEKAVSDRVKKAIEKIRKWEDDMIGKVQGIFKQGWDQVEQFRVKLYEIIQSSSNTSSLLQLDTMNTLEAIRSFDNCKQTVDKLESELKVYQNARLVPQEDLREKWTVELGDVDSAVMLDQLRIPNGMHTYCPYAYVLKSKWIGFLAI